MSQKINKTEFQKLVGSIKPIKSGNRSNDFYKTSKKKQVKIEMAEDFSFAPISHTRFSYKIEDIIYYRDMSIGDMTLKKLASGKIPPYEIIDLHGMTLLEAEVMLKSVIDSIDIPTGMSLKIVHGKGYNAKNEDNSLYDIPKMKNFLALYLEEHNRVLAFHSCPPKFGGTGAVYAILKKIK